MKLRKPNHLWVCFLYTIAPGRKLRNEMVFELDPTLVRSLDISVDDHWHRCQETLPAWIRAVLAGKGKLPRHAGETGA